jgi:hypothetical protein
MPLWAERNLMSDMEKIQFGEQVFDLVANGVELDNKDRTITFQKGNLLFDNIELNLQNNGAIRQINTSGEIDWSRTDLVFDGIITQNPNYDIGNGVKGTVLIAKFRLPDTREKIKDTDAKVAYLSMMMDIELEVMSL